MIGIGASVLALCVAIAGSVGMAPVEALMVSPSTTVRRRHQRQSNGRHSSSLSSSVIDEIDTFYQSFPYASAFITCGIKASAADFVAQKNEVIQEIEYDRNDDHNLFTSSSSIPTATVEDNDGIQTIDAKRNFSFIMYGGLYQGVAQLIIFNQIYPHIFGDGTDVITVLSKVAFDNAVSAPLICLPVAYLVKSVVFQFSLEEAVMRYVQDAKDGLIFKYWCFWVPAQSLTFSVIPPHLRIAFVAAVSFFWLVVFSSISSNASEESAVGEES